VKSVKTTVLHSHNAFQQSKYLKKNVDWRILLKFDDFRKIGAGLRAKVVDNDGRNMS